MTHPFFIGSGKSITFPLSCDTFPIPPAGNGANSEDLAECQPWTPLPYSSKDFKGRLGDHRRTKKRVRVMQTFQVFRNARVAIAGIKLVHQFQKENRNHRSKKSGGGVLENPWMRVPAG